MRYDLELFLALNEEYRSKPLVKAPPKYDSSTLVDRGKGRADYINAKIKLSGKRVLEIGCGRGEVCRAVNKHYGCETVGVDITSYSEWEAASEGVRLIQVDLAEPNPPDLGTFDVIYSNSVWEHVRHPFTMLKRSYELLKPGGRFLFIANLYRGPMASHRYRDVFFPWPHLLFSDEVFADFYVHSGRSAHLTPKTASWVNQLSIADYYHYFKLIGFELKHVKFSTTPFDEDFAKRFADKLDRFPRYDLERDFIYATLVKPSETSPRFNIDLTRPLRSHRLKRLIRMIPLR